VSEDVATDGLPTIRTSKECTRSRVALDLVGQEDGNVELWLMSVIVNRTASIGGIPSATCVSFDKN